MPTWSCAPGAAILSVVSGMVLLVERDDLDPVRTLAGRCFADELERATRGIDRVGGERFRFLPRDDEELPRRVDREPARLLLGRGAREVSQLAARRIDRERGERARGALRGIEELAVGREVEIRGPDVVLRVARVGARRARLQLGVRRQRRGRAYLREKARFLIE